MSFEEETYIDFSIVQNKILEEKSADMELMEQYDINSDDIEEEIE